MYKREIIITKKSRYQRSSYIRGSIFFFHSHFFPLSFYPPLFFSLSFTFSSPSFYFSFFSTWLYITKLSNGNNMNFPTTKNTYEIINLKNSLKSPLPPIQYMKLATLKKTQTAQHTYISRSHIAFQS